ncbi:sigma-54-dependent transcriptional regulator [Desulfovibrio sp. TomC]|uniref:sigma-54-dependent transcriptional regulator n=1 Tax=Desulfovibrio sp. TomC TaxID=1562888 RepID=UPI0005751C03|nr:sigma-54 dependent transcriptional regulator [Desulfovibrio sp. TomC]KHK01347.1 Sigma-54 dependent DNA-binding response regulator [Desulfovibrio sp. TomC]
MTEACADGLGILLVDDEADWLQSMTLLLEVSAGFTNVRACQDSRQVLDILEAGGVGLVLLDLTMPHVCGTELLAAITERHPDVACIVLSGLNQLATAVTCMKLGAYDYCVKTDDEGRIVGAIVRAMQMLELRAESQEVVSRVVSGSLRHPEAFAAIRTHSPAMRAVFAYIEAVAKSPRPLLVTGESGVGKEALVRAAHALSGRSGPLVALNVAGLDDTAFTDTLFGHVRGAFTGAEATRRGLVEEAAGGTLFLDEIGDLAVASQVKLLRLLQEGEYYPLGCDQPRRLCARVIAATHADLAAREREGIFRRDLYFRLRTHHVAVPPLRERPEDIEPLLDHFLAEAAAALGKRKPTPPRELAPLLATYAFPGNIRELAAMVYDAVSLHTGRMLSMDSFKRCLGEAEGPPAIADDENPFAGLTSLPSFAKAEKLLLAEALARSAGRQTLAARLLGVTQSALSKRLKALRQGND